MSDRYDIVGGGFTAGIYAARDRCRALLVERFSYGFPDHDLIFARLDALREQAR